jgi:excisionase family DNA binding protein
LIIGFFPNFYDLSMTLFSMLTVSQAAESLGICTSTLRRWEKSGKIASKRTIGGHRRYPTNIYNLFYGIADSDYFISNEIGIP